jgi:hypothetical protein
VLDKSWGFWYILSSYFTNVLVIKLTSIGKSRRTLPQTVRVNAKAKKLLAVVFEGFSHRKLPARELYRGLK